MTVAGQTSRLDANEIWEFLFNRTKDAVPEELTTEILADLAAHINKLWIDPLTELQHRREAEAGFREFAKMVDESPHPERSAHLSADGRAQAAFAMLDNFKRQARALAAVRSLAVGDEGIREGVTGTGSVDVLRELAREEVALGYADHAKWLRYAANRLSSFDALRIAAALAGPTPPSRGEGE